MVTILLDILVSREFIDIYCTRVVCVACVTCVAVCCSVLQCVAVCCSVSQNVVANSIVGSAEA